MVRFLGLSEQPELAFPHANPNKRARSAGMRRFLADPPPALRRAIRTLVPAGARRAAYRRAVDLNAANPERGAMPAGLRDRLRAELDPDVSRARTAAGTIAGSLARRSVSQPQRVLFLLPSIRLGGMERLVSILARGLDPERFAVEIVVLHRRDENPDFARELPATVPIRSLDKRSRYDLPRTLRRLVGELRGRRPAAAIGFMTYQNLLLVAAARMAGTRTPVIATEHVTPDALRATGGKRLQLGLAARAYRRAAAVVPVSNGLRTPWPASWACPSTA